MMFKSLYDVLRQKDLLEPAVRQTDDTLDLAKRLVRETTGALLFGTPVELDVYATDKKINEAEIEVRRMVFEHLAVQQSPKLITAVVLLTTIIDVERIGDYAKNLYQQTQRLDGDWPEGDVFDRIVALREELLTYFDDTCVALREGDVARAEATMKALSDFGNHCEGVVDALCTVEGASPRQVIVAALAARYLKRIGAHLSNLASGVVNPVDRIGFRPAEVTEG